MLQCAALRYKSLCWDKVYHIRIHVGIHFTELWYSSLCRCIDFSFEVQLSFGARFTVLWLLVTVLWYNSSCAAQCLDTYLDTTACIGYNSLSQGKEYINITETGEWLSGLPFNMIVPNFPESHFTSAPVPHNPQWI